MKKIAMTSEIQKLIAGNARFASGLRSIDTFAATGPERRQELARNGQTPFAVVLCCSDSRVPAETIFDCGLGELFVVRVAGNVVAPSLLGSIEFAVSNFGTKLVVVLGHSQCGAVKATIDTVKAGSHAPTDNIQQIVLEIEPSARKAEAEHPSDPNACLAAATLANVERSMQQLKSRSVVLDAMARKGELTIAGAVYNLHTGKVSFEGVEAAVSAQPDRVGRLASNQSAYS